MGAETDNFSVNQGEDGFFSVDDKDVEHLKLVTQSLGHKVRLLFKPEPVKGKGPQPNPTHCKLIHENRDADFANYVFYEIEKNRRNRKSVQNVLHALPQSGSKWGRREFHLEARQRRVDGRGLLSA